jgi:PAS domain S-box-containing protein
VNEFLKNLFGSSDFTAPQHPSAWPSGLVWLHKGSDLFIGLAFLTIAATLIYFVRKRREMPFSGVLGLFAAFILACGVTHLLEVVLDYAPLVPLSGVVKCLTALASWAAVIAVIRITPRALAMRSPEDLAREIESRKQVEQHLEKRVEERTADLRAVNEALQRESTEHRRSEEKFRSLLEAAPDAMVIINEAGTIVLTNSQTEAMFGYRREELIGRKVEILVPERFRSEHGKHRARFLAEGVSRPMGTGRKLYGLRKDGQEFRVEIGLSLVPTDEGVLVLSAIRDSTQRERILADMHKAEVRFRTLVEKIPAVTFIASLDDPQRATNELYVSPQIEALLGFTQKEWLEDPILWYRQLHPEDRDRWNLEFAPTCGTGKPFSAVYRFLARDGKVVWVRGEAQVITEPDGQPIFLQGVAFDITAIKQAEEDLRHLNQTLEDQVRERTALAEQRAQALAQSNANLDQFCTVVTHDLRQPLRTMKSFTQKLAAHCQDQLDDKGREYVERIVRGAERMRVLIDDLLTFSRVATKKKDFARIDGAELFKGACANLQAEIEGSGAQVTAGALPVVWGDDTQLMQLLQNLIDNALKFRAEGQKQPQIRVEAREQDGEWLFTVTDNGIGIEREYLQRIFGLGERLFSISQYPGNGIGLATCEKIVYRHAGRIWADSPGPGQGATISFTLPVRAGELVG